MNYLQNTSPWATSPTVRVRYYPITHRPTGSNTTANQQSQVQYSYTNVPVCARVQIFSNVPSFLASILHERIIVTTNVRWHRDSLYLLCSLQKGQDMKKCVFFMLLGLFILCATTMGGCLAISAEERCSCIKNREQFAELVAEKVIEKQRQKGFRNP